MADPYLSGAVFIDLGPDGGTYEDTGHRKGCIHTTEGSSLAGAEAAFGDYPPHLGYDPATRVLHQYIRLDRHSLAFKGYQSDDEAIIQVEIVGFANQTHTWPAQYYRNIGEDVVGPLAAQVGIPANTLTFYGEGCGFTLASPDSPIRLSDTELRNYSGWLGHQHIPAPDSHWDPGAFRMIEALSYAGDDMELNEPSAVPKPDGSGNYSNGEIQYWDNRYINETRVIVDQLNATLSQLAAALVQLVSVGFTLTAEGAIVLRPDQDGTATTE
jgi:hypothetical protein